MSKIKKSLMTSEQKEAIDDKGNLIVISPMAEIMTDTTLDNNKKNNTIWIVTRDGDKNTYKYLGKYITKSGNTYNFENKSNVVTFERNKFQCRTNSSTLEIKQWYKKDGDLVLGQGGKRRSIKRKSKKNRKTYRRRVHKR